MHVSYISRLCMVIHEPKLYQAQVLTWPDKVTYVIVEVSFPINPFDLLVQLFSSNLSSLA